MLSSCRLSQTAPVYIEHRLIQYIVVGWLHLTPICKPTPLILFFNFLCVPAVVGLGVFLVKRHNSSLLNTALLLGGRQSHLIGFRPQLLASLGPLCMRDKFSGLRRPFSTS